MSIDLGKKVKRIHSQGMIKGELAVFIAKRNREGMYVLNRKTSSPSTGNTTNRAENKVYVATLNEASKLLETNEYLINLVSEYGVRALKKYQSVTIEYEDI